MTRITDPRDRRRRHRAPEVDHLAAAVRLDMSLQEMRARDAAAGAPERGPDEPPTGLIDLNAIRALLGQPVTEAPDPAAAAWLAGGADPDAARIVEEVDYLDQIAQAQPEPEEPDDDEPDNDQDTHDRQAAGEAAAALVEDGPVLSFREHFESQVQAQLDAWSAARAAELEQPAAIEYTCEVLGNAFHTAPCGEAQHPTDTLQVAPAFTSEPADARLTWRSRHDPRSLEFGVRRQLDGTAPLTDHLWFPGVTLDQGEEGACVGFGIIDALNALSAGDTDGTADDARALFGLADRIDGDGLTGRGTSVLAGFQAAQQLGKLTGYSWCFGTRDIAQALLQVGPVVLGLPWSPSWFDIGAGGLLTLDGATFADGLGHCLPAVGILLRGPQGQPGPWFVLQNSYGPGWGDGGLGYIHHRDLAQLLHGIGEAAVPVVGVAS